jgi:hypothetical protein
MNRELTDQELHEKEVRDEAELQARDEKVEKTLRGVLRYKRDQARELRDQANELERQARDIETAVKAEWWWDLHPYLGDDTIESLCNVSPADLLGEG